MTSHFCICAFTVFLFVFLMCVCVCVSVGEILMPLVRSPALPSSMASQSLASVLTGRAVPFREGFYVRAKKPPENSLLVSML